MNIVDIACAKTKEAGGAVIREIEVEVGRLAGVMVESLTFCFEAVTRDTMADGAVLRVVDTPARAECSDCGVGFVMESGWGTCPACESLRLNIVQGMELRVLSVTFD